MSDYDDELRWRLETLKVMFEDGKIQIAEHLADGVEESLSKVRYGLDGKIDLSTVDGRIRSMALMADVDVSAVLDQLERKSFWKQVRLWFGKI